MKYLKQFEETTQKFHVGDLVKFKNMNYLKKEYGIPESKLEDLYYF